MKKLLLVLVAAGFYLGNEATAQTVPNGSFENWTSTPYDELNGWVTSNMESLVKHNVLTASKVTGVTGSAIRIETKLADGDTSGGFMSNSFDDPTSGKGGVPYSQKPTGFTGKYMANMIGNDSAVLLVIFKKAGSVISQNFFALGGHGQTNFGTFNFVLNLPSTPDSVIIASASSNLITNIGVSVGSNIVYDDFAFTGTGITQSIPNGNFDAWTPKSLDIVEGWFGYGRDVSRTTDSYKGTYAIKLITGVDDHGQPNSSGISSASPTVSGRPFSNQNDTLVGYYKYTPVGNDTAFISVSASKNGSFVGGNGHQLTAATAFTYFEMAIPCSAAPDSMRIDAQSSRFSLSSAAAGSVLILDEIQLKSAMLHTGILSAARNTVRDQYFPNPAGNVLNIISDLVRSNDAQVSVLDITGKVVMSQHAVAGSMITLNTTNLDAGVYFYVIEAAGQTVRNKFVKE